MLEHILNLHIKVVLILNLNPNLHIEVVLISNLRRIVVTTTIFTSSTALILIRGLIIFTAQRELPIRGNQGVPKKSSFPCLLCWPNWLRWYFGWCWMTAGRNMTKFIKILTNLRTPSRQWVNPLGSGPLAVLSLTSWRTFIEISRMYVMAGVRLYDWVTSAGVTFVFRAWWLCLRLLSVCPLLSIYPTPPFSYISPTLTLLGRVLFLRSHLIPHYVGYWTCQRFSLIHFSHQVTFDYCTEWTGKQANSFGDMPDWWLQARLSRRGADSGSKEGER